MRFFHVMALLILVSCATSGIPSAKSKNSTEIKVQTGGDLIKESKASDWRELDPKNTVYMELKSGRVVMELAPGFAPLHVRNIKQIVKNKYWDGLVIYRSQDNYVVQWGYPGDDEKRAMKKKSKGVKYSLPAEFEFGLAQSEPFMQLKDVDTYAEQVGFSKGFAVGRSLEEKKAWMIHCYGAVGVSRDAAMNSGSGTSLYVITGHSPRHLDRNITVVGRVVSGMEHLSTLRRGEDVMGFYKNKKKGEKIKSVRLASSVSREKRSNIELMKTDTPLFKKYVETRRNRSEDWFHRPAGKVEVCNIPRVTRPR